MSLTYYLTNQGYVIPCPTKPKSAIRKAKVAEIKKAGYKLESNSQNDNS